MMSTNKWKLGTVTVWLLSSSLSFSQTTESVNTSTWSMYQGNAAHTGYVPISVNSKKIKKVWDVEVGEQASQGLNYSIHPATIGKKYVYVARNNYVYSNTLQAFSLTDGHVVWSKNFKNLSVQPTAYADGKVFVQTVNNYLDGTLLRAYEENTGEVVFESPFSAQWHSYNAPVIDNNVVYACSGYMSGLNAYEASSGEQLWSTPFSDLSDNATSAVNKKYALYYNAGVLYKLDKKTGNVLSEIQDRNWQWNGYSDVTPVLFRDNFAFVTANQYLTKFSLTTDKSDFEIANISSNPSIDKKNVYVIKDKHLTAINADTGKTVWSVDDVNYDKVEDIIVTDNLVFVSDGYETKAYSKTNKHAVVWSVKIGGKMSLSSKGLFIVSHDGTLSAFTL